MSMNKKEIDEEFGYKLLNILESRFGEETPGVSDAIGDICSLFDGRVEKKDESYGK